MSRSSKGGHQVTLSVARSTTQCEDDCGVKKTPLHAAISTTNNSAIGSIVHEVFLLPVGANTRNKQKENIHG